MTSGVYKFVFFLAIFTQICYSYHMTKPIGQWASISRDNVIKRSSALNLASSTILEALLQRVDPSLAKGEFYFFFFAGNGALSFGVTILPKILAEYRKIQALKGGVSAGGDDIGFNPLVSFSYPEALRVKDVTNIIEKIPAISVLQAKGIRFEFLFSSR
jgi:hypothetical protein